MTINTSYTIPYTPNNSPVKTAYRHKEEPQEFWSYESESEEEKQEGQGTSKPIPIPQKKTDTIITTSFYGEY